MILKNLPKWQNFAKSGHTACYRPEAVVSPHRDDDVIHFEKANERGRESGYIFQFKFNRF